MYETTPNDFRDPEARRWLAATMLILAVMALTQFPLVMWVLFSLNLPWREPSWIPGFIVAVAACRTAYVVLRTGVIPRGAALTTAVGWVAFLTGEAVWWIQFG